MKSSNGMSLRQINRAFIFITVVLSVILLVSSIITDRAYDNTKEASEAYIKYQDSASDLKLGSDFLTEQVRLFVTTGEIEHMENYFTEANVTKRRDRGLAVIEEAFSGTETYDHLKKAMNNSVRLMDMEYEAMKLVASADDIPLSELPDEIKNWELTEVENDMSDEQKKEKAHELVFGSGYIQYKATINKSVRDSLSAIVEHTQEQFESSESRLHRMFRLEYSLIIITILAALSMVYIYTSKVINPLERHIDKIRNNEKMDVEGAGEMQFLARSYNALMDETKEHHERLSYDASHDPLTGIYNRSAYADVQKTADEKRLGVMLVDVDHFKEVNDTYGHAVGDKILIKVANLLREAFRSEDYVCRIGGDEFAVIMMDASSGLKRLVADKIEGINAGLKLRNDGLPKVSLSIGIAFGDREDSQDDIYSDADKALYRVKERGRDGFEFY